MTVAFAVAATFCHSAGAQSLGGLPPVDSAAASTSGTPTTGVRQSTPLSLSARIRETLTDNVRLTPSDIKESDLVSEITPELRIARAGGRVKMNADYRLHALVYARDGSSNDIQNELNASANVEAIEGRLFVDARAAIAQELLSPLGPRPPSNANITSNRVENRTAQISPYLRGQLASAAEYTLRYTLTASRPASDQAASTIVREVSGDVRSAATRSALGWSLDARSQMVDASAQRQVRDDRARATLLYRANQELQVGATVGWEYNDYVNGNSQSRATYRASGTWQPSPRTRVDAAWEHRFFGNGWDYSAQHRMPFIAIRLSGARDVVTDAQRLLAQGAGVTYEALYAALTGRIADPDLRAEEARRLLNEGGIPGDLLPAGAFITPRVYVNRSHEIAVTALGVRNVVTVHASFSQRHVLDANDPDTNASSNALTSADAREEGITASWTHRLTPTSGLTVLGAWRNSTATGTEASSTQWDSRLTYVRSLGPNTSGSLELRHVSFRSDVTSGFRENAATAMVLHRF